MDLPSRLRAAWEELWIACFAWIPTPLGLALRWLAWRWLFAGCGSVRFGTGLSFVGCRHMRLGDAVRLGRGCIITAGDGELVLGDRVSISPYAHVAADGGRIVMDGTPREIFARAQELTEIGLGVPEATRIAAALQQRGLAVDSAVYTVEELREQLLALRGGGKEC